MSSNFARDRPNGLATIDVAAIRDAVRAKSNISDEAFDRVYPMTHRQRSSVHWTPIDIGLQVAGLLVGVPGARILDVGSGVGKMCIVGALAGDAHWFGVERDRKMVRIAQRVASEIGVANRTSFIHEDGMDLDWSTFGGVYLFNPFAEEAFRKGAIDPLLGKATFIHQVLKVERRLATLRVGARVVTYFGFGGELPPGFELVTSIPARGDAVQLWIRTEVPRDRS